MDGWMDEGWMGVVRGVVRWVMEQTVTWWSNR